jgi:hypothetical protein
MQRADRDILRPRCVVIEQKYSMALAPSFQGSSMPDRDRVPMFQPCYRIYDLVEIRNDNPNYVRSLPRIPRRKPPRRIASWLRALFGTSKRLRQDL